MKKFLTVFILIIVNVLLFAPAAFSTGVPWKNPKMIYTYVPSDNRNSDLMREAFSYWMNVTNNRIIFKYVNNPKKAMINVRFVKDASKSSNMEHALGVTYPTYRQECYGTKCRVYMHHANIDIANNAPGGAMLKKDAVYRIMIHEIGHAIGLNHSSDHMSVMYFQKGSRNQALTKSDFATLAKLYGW